MFGRESAVVDALPQGAQVNLEDVVKEDHDRRVEECRAGAVVVPVEPAASQPHGSRGASARARRSPEGEGCYVMRFFSPAYCWWSLSEWCFITKVSPSAWPKSAGTNAS